ncbi:hypothetical protein SCATT_24920 [Streptantibioticus cattleyicolor NRRL 8057 = DSM 46488]|uniref:Uncharacterized protein n=1 Tax=Streptantibioticus cattleyicolor (strain ATCC 35852 / DSM 46488 / JCM 4925 / NBRC 14057 / NRRL 8057) TaxID=1003195 RepID=G8WU42_STREN|nr:hypothetical protein SCATT_24920 [Streptantibioticus cattleyicolor NRRL 8057 = DSM 46488]
MVGFDRKAEPGVGVALGLVDVEWADGDGGPRRSPPSAVHRVGRRTGT